MFLGKQLTKAIEWEDYGRVGQYDCALGESEATAFVDEHAEQYLSGQLALLEGFRAIIVPGDGNCLTHAASRCILGVEILYHALRKEIRKELIMNGEWCVQPPSILRLLR